MVIRPGDDASRAVRDAAVPLGADRDLDGLIEALAGAQVVLLGEATHGTDEFYRLRAAITRRLVGEHAFAAVAVEADWPDALRVNRYVRGRGGDDTTAEAALGGFRGRFPTWMWRNTAVVELVEWLRAHNERNAGHAPPAGFYGLDLYGMYGAMEEVVSYLERVDPGAAERARRRYGCFGDVRHDAQRYGWQVYTDVEASCEDDVLAQLLELRRNAGAYRSMDGRVAEDELFHAEQSARAAVNAEEYYREMYRGAVSSWNLRDRHMAGTLEALVEHLRRSGTGKVVVWEHNSHVGDARATEMGRDGELNVGQLARERFGAAARNVGFTTDSGTVTAASDWGGIAERKRVRPAADGSYERVFHDTGIPAFVLEPRRVPALSRAMLERAIGVVYRPETERISHYFRATLPDQFDYVIHVDETTALEPLERTPTWIAGEPPETYPSAY